MKKLVVALAAAGLLGVSALAAHAAGTLPQTNPGSCSTTAATGTCTFTSGPATGGQNATGVISGSNSFTITAASTACAMTIPPSPVPGPTLPTPPVGSLSADGLTYTGTSPGAASIGYINGCTYTLTVNAGAASAGQTN